MVPSPSKYAYSNIWPHMLNPNSIIGHTSNHREQCKNSVARRKNVRSTVGHQDKRGRSWKQASGKQHVHEWDTVKRMPNSQSKETPSNKGTETSRQVQKVVRRDDSTKSQAEWSEANPNRVETIIRTGSSGPHFLEQIKQNTAFVRQMIDHFNGSMRQMTLHLKQLPLFFTESAISAK